MYILSGHESKIYELIREGIQPTDIAKRAEYRKVSSLYTVVQRLTALGFLEKIVVNRVISYHPLITEYEIIDNLRLRSAKRHNFKPLNLTVDEPFAKVKVTNDQRKQIFDLCMSGKRTSVISHEVGLPRYIVNREIINLGLEQEN